LTTHLALISTHLPALKSKGEEDPLFDDDWAAAVPLYNPKASQLNPLDSKAKGKRKESTLRPQQSTEESSRTSRPPVTLLVICIGSNIVFDPSAEEIAAAETVVAITVAENHMLGNEIEHGGRSLSLRALRMIDPPARMSQPGTALDGTMQPGDDAPGVWKPPQGGVRREAISKMVKLVLEKGGVGEEVLAGLEAVMKG